MQTRQTGITSMLRSKACYVVTIQYVQEVWLRLFREPRSFNYIRIHFRTQTKTDVIAITTRLWWRSWHCSKLVSWSVGRVASSFSTKIGYIRDEVLDGDLVLPG